MLNPYLIGGIVLSFIIGIGGAYTVGYVKGTSKAEVKLAEYSSAAEKKINDLEKKVKTAEGKVVIEYVDRVKKVKEKEYIYVDQAKTNVPSSSELNNGWVYLHDVSAVGKEADRQKSNDDTPSGVADNEALAVVVSNYSRCRENAEQLRSLQTWVSETKKQVDMQNDKN